MRMLVCLMVLAVTSLASAQGAQSLPPAVKSGFDRAYPGATITAATQERDNNLNVFRVDSLQNGKRRIVLYDPNGAVIEIAEQIDEKDLPQPVAAALHSHPRAIYGIGFKVARGGAVEYRLTVRGTRKTSMVAKPDGTVVSFK